MSLGSIPVASAQRSHDGDHTEVPWVLHGQEVLETNEVPTPWYNHINSVTQLRRRLSDRYLDRDGVLRVAQAAGEQYYGGKRGLKINIEIDPTQEVNISPPNNINGISIDITEGQQISPVSCNEVCNDTVYDPVPGGAKYSVEYQDNEPSGGTTSAKVYYNGNYGILTCAHTFFNDDCGRGVNGDMYQLYQEYVGDVYVDNEVQDWAIVLDDSSEKSGFTYELRDTGNDFRGQGSEYYVNNLISSNEIVEKYGAATCFNSGEIIDIGSSNTDCGTIYDQVNFGIDINDGDSGGPVYNYDSGPGGDLVYVCMANRGADCSGQGYGVSGYKLANSYDIRVGRGLTDS